MTPGDKGRGLIGGGALVPGTVCARAPPLARAPKEHLLRPQWCLLNEQSPGPGWHSSQFSTKRAPSSELRQKVKSAVFLSPPQLLSERMQVLRSILRSDNAK